jgi:putative serine protease PepD
VAGLVTNRNRSDRTVYATPIAYALHIARDIIVTGTARHAWIGVLGVDRDASENDGSLSGTVVTEVAAGGPAEQAGLRSQDVIVEVMGIPIDSASSLVVAIRDFDPGDLASVVYLRDGITQNAVITLGDRPADVDAPR